MITLPPLAEIVALGSSDYERDFLRLEFELGLEYYQRRIDRLMLRGDHVLDAGCGAGQWTLALATRFNKVSAIDINANRLEVLRQLAAGQPSGAIDIRQGSIEELPYADATFDAVVCYGVIMFTRVAHALAEFHRVLRPGGRAYCCLNGEGWSQYLIRERGLKNPALIPVAKKTLYKTAWRRAMQLGMDRDLAILRERRFADALAHLPDFPFASLATRFLDLVSDCFPNIRTLRSYVAAHCGNNGLEKLRSDLMAALDGADPMVTEGPDRAWSPDEFSQIATTAGFVDFQWSTEGMLVCDWKAPTPPPRYNGYFEGQLAVWECLLQKPAPIDPTASIAGHLAAARIARELPLYVEVCADPVVSNGSVTFPSAALESATRQASRAGGVRYLRSLANVLTRGAGTEEQAFSKVVNFVQEALYRDPVCQPITSGGGLPDAATILFCARGRCGHAAKLVAELCRQAGLDARETQVPKHVIAEVRVGGRWVIADADAFKLGVLLTNRRGELLSLEDIQEDPLQLDRFPAIGWYLRPGGWYTSGVLGYQVSGYIDALEPDQRGYVSGHFDSRGEGYPPSLPRDIKFTTSAGRLRLEWEASILRSDRLLGYRVVIGTRSRGWSYDQLWTSAVLHPLPNDVLSTETTDTFIEGSVPAHARGLFASITPYSSRVEREPETHFRPSEEVMLELG